ncbi:MAG TPA: sigma-70 family RNA polymerase sigma factor [Gaiellaceae bacterium]|nr:sigma-70 family RNA polymerase sigma factor [Gaiellaceae bacterium]
MLATRPERTFERLYRRHVADVYRFSLSILRDPADAEDVTQTTFLNALRALRRGERPRDARHWLLAIAHNACRQHFRDAARRPQKAALHEEATQAPAALDGAPAQTRELLDALQVLSLNQRSALVMRELEGRSYAEIAEVLGVSVGAIETLLFRARRALREQLDGSVTCDAAEALLSKEADGTLGGSERAELRAHLRSCGDCAAMARRERARRAALGSLVLLPLPPSLAEPSPWLSAALGYPLAVSGGGVTAATAAKAGALAVAAVVLVGVAPEVPRGGGDGADGVRQSGVAAAVAPDGSTATAPVAVDPDDPRFSAVVLLTDGLQPGAARAASGGRDAASQAPRAAQPPRATRPARAPTPARREAPAAPARTTRSAPAPRPAPAPASEAPAPAPAAPAAEAPQPPAEPQPRGRARRPLDGLVPVPAPPPETPPGHHVRDQNERGGRG